MAASANSVAGVRGGILCDARARFTIWLKRGPFLAKKIVHSSIQTKQGGDSMRLFVMLFAGLLAWTGPSNAATVSITCHLFAGGPPSNVPSTDNVPLMYVLTLDYLPFAIDDSAHSISSPALTDVKFEATEFTDKRIVALALGFASRA
jgi:hypothetical protein